MELLSNAISQQMASNNSKDSESTNSNDHLLAGILNSFETWDINSEIRPTASANYPSRNSMFLNNLFGRTDMPNDIDARTIQGDSRNVKLSPESSNNSSISCSWCELNASMRCLECNEFMCNDCLREHRKSPISSSHSIISLPTPIGTTAMGNMYQNVGCQIISNYICDLHNEIMRYVCEYCKKLVCQCCTLHDHKEHKYTLIEQFIEEAKDKIDSALESSRVGTKCIKSSIDRALAFIRLIERNCAELSDNIRKAFRQFIIAIEDRERFLLEFVEKLRQRRLATLHDQMAGLKSALSGLAETSEMLHKIFESTTQIDEFAIAIKITNGQRQLEQFAAIYKDLQPKQEAFAFVAPDYNILQELRNQGGIILVEDKNLQLPTVGHMSSGLLTPDANSLMPITQTAMNVAMPSMVPRRPMLRDGSFRIQSPALPGRVNSVGSSINNGVDWELKVMQTSPGLHFSAPRNTQTIPGCSEPVKARNSKTLSLSFATEGHEDGQVSRPWGVCVDKMGNILISDRRNNRVQVFSSDGVLKFKFGRKGVGNGEFDLPAGICVDIDNRIIVVDKDNHRVQIFTASGTFLLKFGSYGKEYGQFQYPWDVAVNSRRQIVVTDSRNHRIQQFDSEGRFIRQIVFDNHGQNKGIASPRGVCYTPTGNIIVSDFDNHCLYLIDPDINEILSAKGHEGSGFQEFNRPSGLCCDDEGRILVADSKNQRIVVFSPSLEYLWDIEIRPSVNPLMPTTLDEKDRTCDVALMPDGRIVFLIELSPDSKEGSNPFKRFVHIF